MEKGRRGDLREGEMSGERKAESYELETGRLGERETGRLERWRDGEMEG